MPSRLGAPCKDCELGSCHLELGAAASINSDRLESELELVVEPELESEPELNFEPELEFEPESESVLEAPDGSVTASMEFCESTVASSKLTGRTAALPTVFVVSAIVVECGLALEAS